MMRTFKKVLSVAMALVMALAMCIPAFASSDYDRAKVAQKNTDYISSLTAEQTAGIILDWLDRKIASVTADFNNFEANVFDETVKIPLDIDSIEDIFQYIDYASNLGGDFANMDYSTLKTLKRSDGDLAFIKGIAQFAADNAETLGKLAQWEEGKTFDLGKVGDYIDTLEDGSEIKTFVETYIEGGDLNAKVKEVVADILGYTPTDSDTLDDIVNNGVINNVVDLLKNNGLVSDDAAAKIKTDIDLKKLDVYTALKNLVKIVMDDNEAELKTAYTYYLDNLVRPMLKTVLGYVETEGAAAALPEDHPYVGYLAELKALAGDNAVLVKCGDAYYSFKLDADNNITDVKSVTWTQQIKIEPVYVTVSDNNGEVKKYQPVSADIAPVVYTTYADKLEGAEDFVKNEAIPENISAIIANTEATELSKFVQLDATQGDTSLFNLEVDFSDVEAYAEETAATEGLKAMKAAFDKAGVTYSDDLAVNVDVTLTYTAYATDDAFVAQVTAAAVPTFSGTVTYTLSGFGPITVDINAAISIVKSLGIDVEALIKTEIDKVLVNPVATVVVENLGAGAEGALAGAQELLNFLDTDFDIDYSIIDFYGNYDAHNGLVGQVNDILCGVVKMLTSDAGYESLALAEGLNNNLTDNMQKICDKANDMMNKAESFMNDNDVKALIGELPIDAFDSSLLFDLVDFSSVENLYVSGIKTVLKFASAENDTLAKLNTAVADAETLDEIAVAAVNVAFPEINKTLTDNYAKLGYSYTYTDMDVASTDNNGKDVIMNKVADFALYVVTFASEKVVPDIFNGIIDSINEKLGEDIPHVSFTFGVTAGATWTDTLTAIVDRIYEVADGICIPATDYEGTTLADKISNLACELLPMGSLLSNCASDNFCCDAKYVSEAIFDKALAGDLDNFLRLFETAEKTDDLAKDVTFTKAVINACEHISDAFLPDTIISAEYTAPSDTLLQDFNSGDSAAKCTAYGIKSANNLKDTSFKPLLLLVRDSGILPYFCQCDDDAHTWTTQAAVAATCTKEGKTECKVCSVCGKTEGGETIPVDADNHTNIVDVAEVAATCTKAGTTAGKKCADCGKVISGCTATALKAHTEKTVAGKAATCTEAGYTDSIICADCGKVIKAATEIAATGHDYDDSGVCKNCGSKKPEEKKSFFQKIADFFQKIINWFKNLFNKK